MKRSERPDALNPDGCKDDERRFVSKTPLDFADPEELDDLKLSRAERAEATAIFLGQSSSKITEASEAMFESKCKKCNGSGLFRSSAGYVVGKCFSCKGLGYFKTKTHPDVLEHRRQQRVIRAKKLKEKTTDTGRQFLADNPLIKEWLARGVLSGHRFAISLQGALLKYGSLTQRQIGAIQKDLKQRKLYIESQSNNKRGNP